MSTRSAVSTSVEELLALRVDAARLMRASRKRVHQQQTGPRASRSLGRGLDFAESRIYQPGDDVRNMDWNVTARSGVAHSKLFVEEREKPTLLLVDLTPGMWFATRGMFKSMLVARLAALLAWCASATNDRVGGVVTTGDWHREIPAQPGRRGVMALIRYLVEASEQVGAGTQSGSTVAATTDDSQYFVNALEQVQRLARGGGDVVVLSDFTALDTATDLPAAASDDASKQPLSPAQTRLALLARVANLTLIHAYDPIEQALPTTGRLDVIKRGVRAQLAQSRNQLQQHAARFAARSDNLKTLSLGSGRIGLLQVATAEEPVSAVQRLLQTSQ